MCYARELVEPTLPNSTRLRTAIELQPSQLDVGLGLLQVRAQSVVSLITIAKPLRLRWSTSWSRASLPVMLFNAVLRARSPVRSARFRAVNCSSVLGAVVLSRTRAAADLPTCATAARDVDLDSFIWFDTSPVSPPYVVRECAQPMDGVDASGHRVAEPTRRALDESCECAHRRLTPFHCACIKKTYNILHTSHRRLNTQKTGTPRTNQTWKKHCWHLGVSWMKAFSRACTKNN